MRTFHLITHPNVVISRDVPVPRWHVTSIYCSTEQKAIDGAEILAGHLGIRVEKVEELGENDRSATGFLPPEEFERVARLHPRTSRCAFMVARHRYLSSRALS